MGSHFSHSFRRHTTGVLRSSVDGAIVKSGQERRGHNRVILDLPLDFQVAGSSYPRAGIAVNGSERGLLIHSLQKMPIGTEVKVDVLFPDEFELANFKAKATVVRTVRSENGQKGYGYGARILQIDEADYRKLRRILIGRRHGLADGGIGLSSWAESRSKKKGRSLGSFLLNLVGIIKTGRH
jgi:hypothetical protein